MPLNAFAARIAVRTVHDRPSPGRHPADFHAQRPHLTGTRDRRLDRKAVEPTPRFRACGPGRPHRTPQHAVRRSAGSSDPRDDQEPPDRGRSPPEPLGGEVGREADLDVMPATRLIHRIQTRLHLVDRDRGVASCPARRSIDPRSPHAEKVTSGRVRHFHIWKCLAPISTTPAWRSSSRRSSSPPRHRTIGSNRASSIANTRRSSARSMPWSRPCSMREIADW